MTVTAQRRQPPVVPLTLTSDLTLQQSPQQLSPTALSSPINVTQVRFICAGPFLSTGCWHVQWVYFNVTVDRIISFSLRGLLEHPHSCRSCGKSTLVI